MAYSFFISALRWIPKWFLVGGAACFIAYYTGISHGREPYKLAAAVQNEINKYQNKDHKQVVINADKLRKQSYEEFNDYACVIDGADADKLSNYADSSK
ncbi:MAG: hypothetical protein COB24_08760 [Hyphomicrobiales bacterium]|nr:MAG: hypothetical protein COB24_08760 [Hyphomicrobiales bacterium]